MSYAYVNGNGVGVLQQYFGASEPPSNLGLAHNQLVAYLKDPIAGPARQWNGVFCQVARNFIQPMLGSTTEVPVLMSFGTVVADANSIFDSTSMTFTMPYSGYVMVDITQNIIADLTPDPTAIHNIYLYKDAILVQQDSRYDGANGQCVGLNGKIMQVSAGNVLTVKACTLQATPSYWQLLSASFTLWLFNL